MAAGECKILDINHMDKDAKMVIFGAGMYGKELYAYLRMKEISKQVISFMVSNKRDNPDNIDLVPVKEVSQLKEELKECVVLLAIGRTHAGEAISLLKDYKIKDLYGVTANVMEQIVGEMAAEMKQFPLEQNKIFFSCYEGMGYRCNCKYIAQELIQGNYPVKMVWVVTNGNGGDIPEPIKKVEPYTPEYYRELYTSKICVTNNTGRLFGNKREGQYYINTWHGFGPFKKVQGSISINKDRLLEIKDANAKYDLFLTGSSFYSQVYRDSFFYEGEIYECGAPRNDIFFGENGIKNEVYERFKIPADKKIALYAPTFRTNLENSFDQYDLDMEKVTEALHARFGEAYVMMYRFHHHLYRLEKCGDYYRDGIDATYYPDVQELLAAADVVITDYSSLMWDFSLQRKPVFLYQNDEADYKDDRGFYCPISQWPYPQARHMEELLEVIRDFDEEGYRRKLDEFLRKYGSRDDGKASLRAAEKIMEVIKDG